METIECENGAGQPMRLLARRTQGSTPRPAILWIHGGGWRHGSASDYQLHMERTALFGAHAFAVPYRLQTDRVQVRDCLADCRAAVRFLRSHGQELGVSRIVAAGESAGGHLACCLGTPRIVPDALERADCVVNVNGVTDMTRVFKEHLCEPDRSSAARWVEQQAAAEALSPLFNVEPGCAPTLHVQGLEDTVVEPEMTWRYHRALQNAGVQSEILLLPGLRHAFLVPDYERPNEDVRASVDGLLERLAQLGWIEDDPANAKMEAAECE